MKRCSAKPYEGSEKYIFVSYCHKDKQFVFPIIEQLARDGYRVWYDEGIDPGSEWPEIIAHHLNGCAACIAFISDNSLNSHNCRREINFALLKKKPFISVILEQVEMSLGMEMQLSATQSIFKYTLPNERDFYNKLYDAKFLHECLGQPDLSITVSSPRDYEEGAGQEMFGESNLKRDTFSDKWFIGKESQSEDKEEPVVNTDTDKVSEEPVDNGANEEEIEVEPVEAEENQKDDAKDAIPEQVTEKTFSWLVRVNNNEQIMLNEGETKLGRSKTMSDYAILGNSAIGRYHARILNVDSKCSVIDNESMNKTYLNGEELVPLKEYELREGDAVRLANENFIFHQEKRISR